MSLFLIILILGFGFGFGFGCGFGGLGFGFVVEFDGCLLLFDALGVVEVGLFVCGGCLMVGGLFCVCFNVSFLFVVCLLVLLWCFVLFGVGLGIGGCLVCFVL